MRNSLVVTCLKSIALLTTTKCLAMNGFVKVDVMVWVRRGAKVLCFYACLSETICQDYLRLGSSNDFLGIKSM